jgi:hypothetical protein
MQRSRRKKIFLFLLCFLLILLALGYLFRYPLIRQVQYMRLRSLDCATVPGGDCMQKVWVHRVNSRERYELLKGRFSGFETDITYDSAAHSFAVYPPPQPAAGDTLSLQRFLQKVNTGDKHFWFDTRNVNGANAERALEAFGSLPGYDGIKRHSIIELYDLAAAKYFSKQGYTVGYNVPEQLMKNMLSDKRLQDSISAELADVKYVSQDSGYIFLLKKLLPGKPVITWHTQFDIFTNKKEIKDILNDPAVAIVLVSIKSRHYR